MAEEHTEETVAEGEEACELVSPAAKKLIEDKDKQLAALTDDLKRLQAEFENFKKRTAKETTERVRYANQLLIKDILMVLDSLDKAIEDTNKAAPDGGACEGFRKVRRQLMQILEREGLKEIDTRGKLDPFLHEAVLSEEKTDAEDGKILEVYQKGYVLGNQAIRPAKVKVARKKEPKAEPTPEEAEAKQKTPEKSYEVK